MAIGESIGRVGATLLAMVQTRLELAAVEMEEEYQRLLGYLLMSLLALFLLGISLLLVALLVIVIFWDTHRIEAVCGMAALFGIGAAWLGLKVRADFRVKPRLLAATVGELRKDVDYIRTAGHDHEQ